MHEDRQTILLRLAAFVVDALTLALLLILPASLVSYAFVLFGRSINGISVVWYLAMLILFLGILLRDGYHGRSPGKRLLGLRLLTPGNRPCGYARSILRNLPLLIPGLNLVEMILVLFSAESRRAGDRLAGTAVVEE